MIYEHKITLYNSDTWSVQFRRIWFWPLFLVGYVYGESIHPAWPNIPTILFLLGCRPSKQARMQLGKGVDIFWESTNGWFSNKSQKKLLTYPWFNIEAWNKVLFSFSGKKVWKSVALRIGVLAILEMVESFRLCLFDSGFLKSVQYFELTEYVDICSKGVKGWKHEEPFLKLIWRDSGQVDWKFMFC